MLIATMNLPMIALHMPVPSGHHHVGAVGAGPHSTMMAVAALLAAVEVVAAVAVLYRRSRSMARVHIVAATRREPVIH